MNPLLSILIATKNRIPYCINAIETILKLPDSDFELVIQDNSDNLELKDYLLDNINDSRLKYNYIAPPFSSIDNFNAVMCHANGEYICLIGDDDGINPEILKIVRWASQNKIDAIVPALNAVYRWPESGISLKSIHEDNGIMTITQVSGEINQYKTSKEVNKLMNNGGQQYLKLNLPKLYHGIIKKECMDKIKVSTGKYFGGLSPDIYSSVALSLFIDKIIKIDYPLTISGICNKSTSADSATGKHTGQLEEAPHLRGQDQYVWSVQVPKFYSVETIWADSAIAALNDLKRIDLIRNFNLSSLTAICLRNYKNHTETILKHFIEYCSSKRQGKIYNLLILKIKYSVYPIIDVFLRAFRKMLFKKVTIVRIKNIENISQAEVVLSRYLSEHSLSIDLIIKELNIEINKRS